MNFENRKAVWFGCKYPLNIMYLNHLNDLHVICSNEQRLQLKISTTLKRLALYNMVYFYG